MMQAAVEQKIIYLKCAWHKIVNYYSAAGRKLKNGNKYGIKKAGKVPVFYPTEVSSDVL